MSVMLAKKHTGQDPTGWWMSEKLDGVRAVWNGVHLISRNGKKFHAPQWFTDALPKGCILDGELWEGRGQFQTTVGNVRAKNGNWVGIKFMIFDVVNKNRLEERMSELKSLSLPSCCRIVQQITCTGQQHLDSFQSMVTGGAGEGVMLRKSGSLYEKRRSVNLLKVKQVKSAEARVIGYTDGQGQNYGRLGALICEYAGKVFKIGSGFTEDLRDIPPAIGSIVTFNYFETTSAGIPRFASFCAVRDYE